MTQETIDRIRKFSRDRDWDQFHTPANLAKSIVIEAGELLECYQWQNEADLEHVKQELADVIVYCRNMLDALGLDEDEIVNAKMDENEKNKLLKKMMTAFKSIDGKIIEHKFITEGGGTEEKESGEIVYYNCYPEYVIKTDKGKEYRIMLSYMYICKNNPSKEGVYDVEIYDSLNN